MARPVRRPVIVVDEWRGLEERLAQAGEDARHALHWGWTPGSTTVRRFFRPCEPWEGLRFWLDTPSEGYSFNPCRPFDAHLPVWRKAPEVKTPEVKAFFEGVARSVHPVKAPAIWQGTRPVEEVLLDAYRRLERES
jgi:hypothetical protein